MFGWAFSRSVGVTRAGNGDDSLGLHRLPTPGQRERRLDPQAEGRRNQQALPARAASAGMIIWELIRRDLVAFPSENLKSVWRAPLLARGASMAQHVGSCATIRRERHDKFKMKLPGTPKKQEFFKNIMHQMIKRRQSMYYVSQYQFVRNKTGT